MNIKQIELKRHLNEIVLLIIVHIIDIKRYGHCKISKYRLLIF